jgi:hypothetical protein
LAPPVRPRAISGRADHNGLEEPVLAYGLHQGLQLVLVELPPCDAVLRRNDFRGDNLLGAQPEPANARVSHTNLLEVGVD